MTPADIRDRLIVALDVGSVAEAERAVETLGDSVTFYKVGMQLAFSGGLGFASDLAASGKKVFLDMKLLDIPNTVAKGIEAIAKTGVAFTTIHAYPQTMRAAAEARGDAALKVLGVTVLTSLDEADLRDTGYGAGVADLVATRARQAVEAGIDGIVASPQEAGTVRGILGQHGLVVTPGIRPTDAETGDQKRTATPAGALKSGASHLVVGRPILASADPKAAAERIVADMATAFD